MNQQEAIKQLIEVGKICGKLGEYFRADTFQFNSLKWDMNVLVKEKNDLMSEISRAKEHIENLKKEATSIIANAKLEETKLLESAHKKLIDVETQRDVVKLEIEKLNGELYGLKLKKDVKDGNTTSFKKPA